MDRRYDLPIAQANTEIAGFLPDVPAERAEPGYRDLLLHLREAPPRHSENQFFEDIADADEAAAAVADLDEPTQDSSGRWYTFVHFEHPLYMPLHYVLFYMIGGRGHSRNSALRGRTSASSCSLPSALFGPFHSADLSLADTERVYDRVTINPFYRWHLYPRQGSFNVLHRPGGGGVLSFNNSSWMRICPAICSDYSFLPQSGQDTC